MTIRNIDSAECYPTDNYIIGEGNCISQDWRDNYFGLDADEREILEFRGE